MLDRKTNRMPSFDYSNRGWYYLTICTQNRVNYFGEVNTNQEVILNDFGKVVESCWDQIPVHFENCNLDEYIVMPNHIHGIIFIESEPVVNRHACSVDACSVDACSVDACSEEEKSQNVNKDRHLHKIPNIIGSFKSAVSKLIHLKGNKGFKWQKSYYDRIIRDNDELINIRQYIIDNPKNWEIDNKGQNENIML